VKFHIYELRLETILSVDDLRSSAVLPEQWLKKALSFATAQSAQHWTAKIINVEMLYFRYLL